MSNSIYIASKTVHAAKWIALKESGINIISTWIYEADKRIPRNLFSICHGCIKEATQCDAMVVYREEGEYLKGAFIEMGIAMCNSIPVYLVGPVLPEGSAFTHYNGGLYQCNTIEEAIQLINQPVTP